MNAYVLWIATLAYALHVVEEYMFDWKGWASSVLKLPVDWTLFAIVNGAVVVLGIPRMRASRSGHLQFLRYRPQELPPRRAITQKPLASLDHTTDPSY
jgi:hypothetical protein